MRLSIRMRMLLSHTSSSYCRMRRCRSWLHTFLGFYLKWWFYGKEKVYCYFASARSCKSKLVKSRCLVEPVWMELIKNRILRLLGSLLGNNCSELFLLSVGNWYLWEIIVRRCVLQEVFRFLLCSFKLWPVCKEFAIKLVCLLSCITKNRLRSQRHLLLTYSNIVCKVFNLDEVISGGVKKGIIHVGKKDCSFCKTKWGCG